MLLDPSLTAAVGVLSLAVALALVPVGWDARADRWTGARTRSGARVAPVAGIVGRRMSAAVLVSLLAFLGMLLVAPAVCLILLRYVGRRLRR